jgi:hypothetical protein
MLPAMRRVHEILVVDRVVGIAPDVKPPPNVDA